MMPRVYKDWKDQSRAAYDTCVRLLRGFTFSDGSMIKQSDIRPFASSLVLWHATMVDFGVPFADAGRLMSRILNGYASCIDRMFEDLGDAVQFARRGSDWQEIAEWICADLTESRLNIIQAFVYFPLWRSDPRHFRAVHGIYSFLVKQTFNRDRLSSEAYDAYVAGEENIITLYDGFGEWCIWKMQKMFYSWFKDWKPSAIASGLKFSSGSTADSTVGHDLRRKLEKLTSGTVPTALASVVKRDLPDLYDELSMEGRVSIRTFVNSIQAVPKTALKKRTIGMEEELANFFQNGLDASIRHCRTFPRKYVRLEDQEHSRQMAIRGSYSRDLATLDYSAASDSVSLHLVRRLTAMCDYRLIQWLEATRSDLAIIPPTREPERPGRHLRLRKFSAMGSVCCFTIESLVFLAIAMLACDLADAPVDVAVYGDDVIVPVEAVDYVRQISEALGFKLNSDKSFAEGPFREACGVFAFDGKDVTTPCASRKQHDIFRVFHSDDEDFRSYVAATCLANEFYNAGMGYSRYLCVMHLVDNGVRFLSGNPENVPTGAITTAERRESNPAWFDTVAPKAPLFVLSEYDGVRTYDSKHTQWLEQPSDRRVVRKVVLRRIVQTYEDGSVLPVPTFASCRVTVWDYVERAFPVDTGKRVSSETYTDEQRLDNWLYRSRFERRAPLHDSKGLRLPFEEPLVAESYFGVVRFRKVPHHVVA